MDEVIDPWSDSKQENYQNSINYKKNRNLREENY